MTKQELLDEITSKALKVVNTFEEPDDTKNAAGVKMYITHVMEQNGTQVKGRNIGWYTIDEGTAQEAAFYRDTVNTKNVARDAVITYLTSKVTDGTFVRFSLKSVDEDDRSARATAVKSNGDGTASEVNLFVYKNGNDPIQHLELI